MDHTEGAAEAICRVLAIRASHPETASVREQARYYDAVRVATKRDVTEKLARGGGVLAALEALLRLRQAACHSKLATASGSTSVHLPAI